MVQRTMLQLIAGLALIALFIAGSFSSAPGSTAQENTALARQYHPATHASIVRTPTAVK